MRKLTPPLIVLALFTAMAAPAMAAGSSGSGITSIITLPAGLNGEVQFNKKGFLGSDPSFAYSTTSKRIVISSGGIQWPNGSVQVSSPAAAAVPAGVSTGSIQLNLGGAFGYDSNLTYSTTSKRVIISSGGIQWSDGSVQVSSPAAATVPSGVSTGSIQLNLGGAFGSDSSLSYSTTSKRVVISSGGIQWSDGTVQVSSPPATVVPAGLSTGSIQLNLSGSFGYDNSLGYSTTSKRVVLSSGGIQWPDGTIQVSSPSAGSATIPAGVSTGAIQLNLSGAFGSDGALSYSTTSKRVVLSSGGIQWPDGSVQVSSPAASSTAESMESRTSTFTASTSKVYVCSASASAFTVTLPAVASSSGASVTFIKGDGSVNGVILDGNSSETINGRTTVTLWGQYQAVTLFCDGTAWYIIRETPSREVSYTPGTNGIGTVSSVTYFYRSWWDRVEISGRLTCGTPTASEMRVNLPGAITASSSISGTLFVGVMTYDAPGPNNEQANALIVASQAYMTFGRHGTSISNTLTSSMNGNVYLGSGYKLSLKAMIPI